MSLYGALFGGVSGLNAQSSKIGAISDNIANVNTIGYKQAEATFSSLVVNSSASVSYQTGGVRAGTRLNVTQQGLLQSTNSNTDLAISGAGFFVVRAVADATAGSGTSTTPLYTRAGSFTPDDLGNFVNTQGFYLQGWPLDRNGLLPGEPGNANTTALTNFDSLRPVNVASASGVAQGTTAISLGANLKSSEVIFRGEAGTVQNDANNLANKNLPADAIYVGSEFGLANADSTRRGDQFSVITGAGQSYNYEYGGFTIGRDVTAAGGSTNYGDAGSSNTPTYSLGAAASVKFGTTPNTFVLTLPTTGLITGDKITLSGFSGTYGTTPASDLNGQQVVTVIGPNQVQVSVATPSGGTAGANAGNGSGAANIRQYAGNILDASTTTQTFLGQLGTTGFTASALTFTITTATGGTQTFSYVGTAPDASKGQFNSLSSLATAIDSTSALTARVVNGRLVVGAEDASEAITFANGDAAGTTGARGIDWLQELDLQNISSGNRRFSSLQGLADLVKSDAGVSATISNPLAGATLSLSVDNPLDTIQFKDLSGGSYSVPTTGTPISIPAGTYAAGTQVNVTITDPTAAAALSTTSSVNISGLTNGLGGLPGNFPNGGPYKVVSVVGSTYTIAVTVPTGVTLAGGNYGATAGNVVSVAGVSNQGSLLGELGLVKSLNGAAYTPQDTGILGPQYDPTGTVGKNMASGDITAQFSRNVRIYDGLGSGHDVRFSFIKTAQNTWAVEAHVIPASDVSSTLPDGQIAVGNITFNGDGTLRSVSSTLSSPININWTNGSVSSNVSLNLGTAGLPFGTVGAAAVGLSDGLSQFDSAYNVNFANQNGAPVGQLVSVAIDKDGIVSASYSNGEIQQLFKIPLASFSNPDGLQALSGNTFTQTQASGEVNLREAGTNGTGSVVASALEASNVDLASQLTDIIVAQRSYQANTKVIKTADDLLNELNQI